MEMTFPDSQESEPLSTQHDGPRNGTIQHIVVPLCEKLKYIK